MGEVTTVTIATTPKKTQRQHTPTTFRSVSRFALPSVIHNNQPLLSVSYSGTSATALCGTTAIVYRRVSAERVLVSVPAPMLRCSAPVLRLGSCTKSLQVHMCLLKDTHCTHAGLSSLFAISEVQDRQEADGKIEVPYKDLLHPFHEYGAVCKEGVTVTVRAQDFAKNPEGLAWNPYWRL